MYGTLTSKYQRCINFTQHKMIVWFWITFKKPELIWINQKKLHDEQANGICYNYYYFSQIWEVKIIVKPMVMLVYSKLQQRVSKRCILQQGARMTHTLYINSY